MRGVEQVGEEWGKSAEERESLGPPAKPAPCPACQEHTRGGRDQKGSKWEAQGAVFDRGVTAHWEKIPPSPPSAVTGDVVVGEAGSPRVGTGSPRGRRGEPVPRVPGRGRGWAVGGGVRPSISSRGWASKCLGGFTLPAPGRVQAPGPRSGSAWLHGTGLPRGSGSPPRHRSTRVPPPPPLTRLPGAGPPPRSRWPGGGGRCEAAARTLPSRDGDPGSLLMDEQNPRGSRPLPCHTQAPAMPAPREKIVSLVGTKKPPLAPATGCPQTCKVRC